jgi:mRNA interferase MazF
MLEQGHIVLIPVPFTDLTSQKRRPVIVISNNAYNQNKADIVVVAMTSSPAPADFAFTINSSDLSSGRLNRPGQIRVDKIYTLAQAIVVKVFGKVKKKRAWARSATFARPRFRKALSQCSQVLA